VCFMLPGLLLQVWIYFLLFESVSGYWISFSVRCLCYLWCKGVILNLGFWDCVGINSIFESICSDRGLIDCGDCAYV